MSGNCIKFQKFVFSLLAIGSLFASSISACACSHHQEKPATASFSCSEHSTGAKTKTNHDGNSAGTINLIVAETECVCFQSAAKTFSKAENVKIEKQAATVNLIAPLEFIFDAPDFSVASDFIKPLYLSDSFYNLSPGRAPPIL